MERNVEAGGRGEQLPAGDFHNFWQGIEITVKRMLSVRGKRGWQAAVMLSPLLPGYLLVDVHNCIFLLA